MNRSTLTRLIPVILIIVIAIVAIAALVALGRAIFSGGSSTPQATDTSESALLSTSGDRGVRMMVRGPIVASENFHTYTIDVSPSARSLTTYQGYDKNVTSNETLANTTPAYEQFVHALDKANLAKGTSFTGDKDDTRGICATGNVYEFAIYQSDNIIKHLWTSTCKGSPGSLDASVTQLQNLFTRQIPDASSVISKTGINGTIFSL